MGKIRILFTIPNFDTAGSGKVVYDLVKGLDKAKFAPEICCLHDRGEFFTEIEALNVPIHVFKFTEAYRPIVTLPFRLLRIVKFFKKHDFDIIHSWHWSSDFTEPLAAKIAGIPFVYTKKAMGWGNRAWHWRSRLSTRIIAINTDMVSEFFGRYRSKIQYMPLGIDRTVFGPISQDKNLRNNLGLHDTDFVVLTVANLVPVKGIEILLEAVKLLKNPQMKVLVVGDDQSNYARNLKATYAAPSILFLGKKMDVRPYLSIADVFVIPTKDEGRKEGLPISPLEAMASGVITIGSNIGGIRDILQDHDEYLFEASNSFALSEILRKVYDYGPQKRELEGKEMLRTVEQSFSLKQCLHAHSELYCELYNAKINL